MGPGARWVGRQTARDCRIAAVERHRLFAGTRAGRGEGEWKDRSPDCGPVLLGGGEPVGWGHGERGYAWKEEWGPRRGQQLAETAVQGLAHTALACTEQGILFHIVAGREKSFHNAGREKSFHNGAVPVVVAVLKSGAAAESRVGGVVASGSGNMVGGLVAELEAALVAGGASVAGVAELGAAFAVGVAELGAASAGAASVVGVASAVEVVLEVERRLFQTGAGGPAAPVR